MGICCYKIHRLLVFQLCTRRYSKLQRLSRGLPWLPRRKMW